MFYYQAFNLCFESDVTLPRLKQIQAAKVDVSIRLGKVSKSGLANPNEAGPNLHLAHQTLWFNVPNIARFLVKDGNSVIVEPYPKADFQSVKLYLLGSAIGAIIHQRHQLILHGNAIKVGDESLIFCGPSGIGKSTLAAGFYQHGFSILADDLAVIDSQNRALPSYPQIKLWKDSADHMQINTNDLKQIHLQGSKFEYPIESGYYNAPLKVDTVFILHKHSANHFEICEVTGLQKVIPLQQQTYRKSFVKGLGLNQQHLQNCANLARSARVIRILRPERTFQLQALIDLVLETIERSA